MTDASAPFADDPRREAAREQQTVTNDAVAGETVEPVDSYAGPDGAEPREAEPVLGDQGGEGAVEPIDLRIDDDPSESGSPDAGRER